MSGIKVELSEVNLVRATDSTFIVHTVSDAGQEITTAPDFGSLVARLTEIFVPSASQQEGTKAVN